MSDVRWRGYSHEELYQQVWAGAGPNGSADALALWSEIEQRLRRIDEALAAEVAAIGGSWEGDAAGAARAALTPLGDWTLDAAGDALLVAQGLEGQADQVAWLQANMPPPAEPGLPEEPPPSLNPPGLDPGFFMDWAAADAVRDDEAERAFQVMDTYAANSGENSRRMSYWSPPPAVTVDTAAAPVSPAAATGGAAWSGTGVPGATTGGVLPGGAVGGAPVVAGAGLPETSQSGVAPAASALPPAGAAVRPGGGGEAVAGAGAGGAGQMSGSGGSVPATGTGGPGAAAGAGRSAAGMPGLARSAGIPHRAPSAGGPLGTGSPLRRVVPAVPRAEPAAPGWRPGHRGADGGVHGSPLPGRAVGSAEPPGRAGVPGEGRASPLAAERALPPGDRAARAATGHGMFPAGVGAVPPGGGEQTRARPAYLVDDTDAFGDDRRFTPPVIGADDDARPH